ncbi:Pao retrotransposon peptidase, partial [Ostertagia ostertagi]
MTISSNKRRPSNYYKPPRFSRFRSLTPDTNTLQQNRRQWRGSSLSPIRLNQEEQRRRRNSSPFNQTSENLHSPFRQTQQVHDLPIRQRQHISQSPLRSPKRVPANRVKFAPLPYTPTTTHINFQTAVHQLANIAKQQIKPNFSNHNKSNIKARLMVVPLRARNENNNSEEQVYALLDSASDQSFISLPLAQRLQLIPHFETTIIVNTFGGHAERKHVTCVETLLVNSQEQSIKVKLLTHDIITHPLAIIDLQTEDKIFLEEKFSNDNAIWLQDSTIEVTPDILLGIDYFNDILQTNEPIIRLPSGLFMTPTFFGPVISGTVTTSDTEPQHFYDHIIRTYTTQCSYEHSDLDYSDLWKLPGVGIDELQTNEELNRQIIANFYSTVQNRNGKIYIQFPWKTNKHQLADNYNLALSIPWNHSTDTLSILCKLNYEPNPTKRKVLQSAHSTFDPLGLLTPLLLPAKIFLQDLWKHKHNWDEPLPETNNNTWKTICEQADGFTVHLPRTIVNNYTGVRYELHSFVDASARAYATVVYLRSTNNKGYITSSILMARQRLAPINAKTMTIPRLELLALLIGVRLTNFLVRELKINIETIRIYSDSQVALHWVQSQTKNGPFVDNRCKEIRQKIQSWSQEHTILSYLHYIPSDNNPADCATKGLTKDQMHLHRWWSGPSFLQDDQSKWPSLLEFSWHPKDDQIPDQDTLHTILSTSTPSITSSEPCSLNLLTKFSSLNSLRHVTALVLKFLKCYIYDRLPDDTKDTLTTSAPELAKITSTKPISLPQAQDIKMAEQLLLKLTQRSLTKEHHRKWNHLALYKDENGVIRCRGRIQSEHLTRDARDPILLLPDQPLTGLIIRRHPRPLRSS